MVTRMKWTLVGAALGALLGAAPARAQDSVEAGRELLARLTEAATREALCAREDKLSLYFGRGRVGKLTLRTAEDEDENALLLSDELELDIPDVGRVRMRSEQRFGADGKLIKARLVTEAPRVSGRMVERVVTLEPVEGGFTWSATADGEVTTQLIGAPPEALPLAPPLGLAARLPKLVGDAERLAFLAVDLETGTQTRLRLTVEPFEDHPFRERKVATRLVSRSEGAANLTSLVDREGRLLTIDPAGGRLRMVGGIDDERFRNLPEAVTGAPADPAAAVVVFLRAIARGVEEDIRAGLDLDALYTAACKVRGEGPEGEREAFESVLIETLLDYGWARDHRLTVNTGLLEPAELKVVVKGREARVFLSGGGAFQLRQGDDERWRVIAMLAPPEAPKGE